ncbi:hypothetical protein Q765_11460 [Flavobacterium rivuli WB 3.3-2 = DSM 21788]|uniref:Uncharacterized protein n=1 Tax=Flavobacterium rivuli WB 3.3-2 = DSM 21788 TaxID=1121895 RepID=A0A0A2M4D5_9FLAO|nr:hypothetical protein Q765_11460 [Flavobacterium rivuli WB 3.3-2 = DSM 21788]
MSPGISFLAIAFLTIFTVGNILYRLYSLKKKYRLDTSTLKKRFIIFYKLFTITYFIAAALLTVLVTLVIVADTD